MGRGDLSEEEWARPGPHLPTNHGRGGRWQCRRRVINGILFRQRTGLRWRDLPSRFGKWKTVHDRHRRWSADGRWEKILRAVQADADAEGRIDWSMVSVDSTTCRAHEHAAGATTRAPKIPGRRSRPARHRSDEALGRSRGGLTCKIHLVGEVGRRPLGFVITSGRQWGDAPGRLADDHALGPISPKPASPAQVPDQAHDPRAERPAGQPPAPRQPRRPARRVRQDNLPTPQRSRADKDLEEDGPVRVGRRKTSGAAPLCAVTVLPDKSSRQGRSVVHPVRPPEC